MDQNYSPQGLTDTIKPTLFHGYENENLERWIEKFRLHLERRRIKTDSKAALAELALHLAGPAESFFRSLAVSNKDDFEKLCYATRTFFLAGSSMTYETEANRQKARSKRAIR